MEEFDRWFGLAAVRSSSSLEVLRLQSLVSHINMRQLGKLAFGNDAFQDSIIGGVWQVPVGGGIVAHPGFKRKISRQ